MAENKLKTALREVVSAEFAEIPRNEREINHSFSDDFLRRMDKLTHAQRSRFWRMTNTVPKRVAAVAAAFLLIALTACSIPSVRAAATTFIGRHLTPMFTSLRKSLKEGRLQSITV